MDTLSDFRYAKATFPHWGRLIWGNKWILISDVRYEYSDKTVADCLRVLPIPRGETLSRLLSVGKFPQSGEREKHSFGCYKSIYQGFIIKSALCPKTSKIPSAFNCSEQGELVCIFKVSSYRNSVCKAGYSHPCRLYYSAEVHGGSLALDRGVG